MSKLFPILMAVAYQTFYTTTSAAYTSQELQEAVNVPYQFSNGKPNFRIGSGIYYLTNGSWGVSMSLGSAYKTSWWQASFNYSLNLNFGRNNLGNTEKRKSNNTTFGRTLFTSAFSPLFTIRRGKNLFIKEENFRDRYYDEINPMYFGNNTVIYNNFQNAFTIGTTFITSPRGTYENTTTPRNRTQQLIFLQVKLNNFQLNVSEDYLGITDNLPFQALIDNRDRYYTGGGNVQFRIFGFMKLKFYSETYTGTSYPDYQDYPDLIYPDEQPELRRKKHSFKDSSNFRSKIRKKYAYQDPGQRTYNNSRDFFSFEFNAGAMWYLQKTKMEQQKYLSGTNWRNLYPKIEIYTGWYGGAVNGTQQHFIHNLMPINRNISLKDSHADRLHHFDYNIAPHDIGQGMWGLGITNNYLRSK
ncbi:MAG TPA: hypothetical protein PLN13_06310 [Bacteroidia bacterium]|nr:hypothetical protein [Bacteroidia bacterium]HRH08177.1 hypothetical protein [Bacteroidia bacterium]